MRAKSFGYDYMAEMATRTGLLTCDADVIRNAVAVHLRSRRAAILTMAATVAVIA